MVNLVLPTRLEPQYLPSDRLVFPFAKTHKGSFSPSSFAVAMAVRHSLASIENRHWIPSAPRSARVKVQDRELVEFRSHWAEITGKTATWCCFHFSESPIRPAMTCRDDTMYAIISTPEDVIFICVASRKYR
jgi:hypothetical protein